MENIHYLTIQNDIDAERMEIHERVEGGTINGGARIEKNGLVLTIWNLGTETEDGDLIIEGYQSAQFHTDEPEYVYNEDFSETEDEILAVIKAFLA